MTPSSRSNMETIASRNSKMKTVTSSTKILLPQMSAHNAETSRVDQTIGAVKRGSMFVDMCPRIQVPPRWGRSAYMVQYLAKASPAPVCYPAMRALAYSVCTVSSNASLAPLM